MELTIDKWSDLFRMISNCDFGHIDSIFLAFFSSFSLVTDIKEYFSFFIIFVDFSQALNASNLIPDSTFFPCEIWDEYKLGCFVFEELMMFLKPWLQVLCWQKLDQHGSLPGNVDLIVDFFTLSGVVINPDDEVGQNGWHLLLSFKLFQDISYQSEGALFTFLLLYNFEISKRREENLFFT